MRRKNHIAKVGFLGLVVLTVTCSDQVIEPPHERSEAVVSPQNAEVVPGQYIIMFHGFELEDVRMAAEELVQMRGGTVRLVYEHAIQGFSASLPSDAIDPIRADSRVAYIGPNREWNIGGGRTVQSDPPWGLDRIDQRDLPLDSEYVYGPSGSGVTAYIIDSGIRYSHDEFEEPGGGTRAEFGFDAIGDGQDGADCHGHGTHVTGTLGGSTYGVAKQVDLVSVRVADCNGNIRTEDLLDGIDWVSANHVHPAVANMSIWGQPDTAIDAAVENAWQNGIVFVVIAGNNNGDDACNYSPAREDDAITVAASNSSDSRWSSSNIGSCIDLFAPGEDILSADIGSDTDTSMRSGTSMAAPHVAGIAALYREVDPGASPPVVFDTILGWATANRLSNIGSGSPNLLAYSNPPPPEPPSVDIDGPTQIQPDATCTWFSDVSGGTPPYSYYWTNDGQFVSSDPDYTGGKLGGSTKDYFDLKLTVTDAASASNSHEIRVNENESAPMCMI